MNLKIQVVYENGVFRPLQKVTMNEHQQTTILLLDRKRTEPSLKMASPEFLAYCASLADRTITLEQVRIALAKIPGNMTEDFQNEREERC